jgi:hypothetical protein
LRASLPKISSWFVLVVDAPAHHLNRVPKVAVGYEGIARDEAPEGFAVIAADPRCYPAVICRCSLNKTGAISRACMKRDVGIGENSETGAIVSVARSVAAICRWFAAAGLLK